MTKRGENEDPPTEPDISVCDAVIAELAIPGSDHLGLRGERFGKYLLVGELAIGGMAEVFLAVQLGPEGFVKVVVLKRALPHLSAAPEFVRMFVNEARLTGRLDHPNIARTYEFGCHHSQYYTVMEYLPGEDLRGVLRRLGARHQHLPVNVAVAIVTKVLAGVEFSHELTDLGGRPLHLVHRDLNPSNIMVTYAGEVKLIDFGVAKTRGTQTHGGVIKGKLAYMAPEQILGCGVDRRADVFSAGVVLWEALTGRRLFVRDNDAATMYAIVNDLPPTPRAIRPEVPPVLETIVMRALSRRPEDRYETAGDMQLALEVFMALQPKVDERVLAQLLDDVFGSSRAEAKRSIAQARSLLHNVALVMKLRTDVGGDPGADTQPIWVERGSPPRATTQPIEVRRTTTPAKVTIPSRSRTGPKGTIPHASGDASVDQSEDGEATDAADPIIGGAPGHGVDV
jgi:serine/threonine protein kinase